tara:strand:- start:3519 stop:3686 length:168 start_codon:yes stop_codon:yes gene_type:complete
MKTTITLTIEHKKPIEDLLDKVCQRVYNLDGIANGGDVTAALVLDTKVISTLETP